MLTNVLEDVDIKYHDNYDHCLYMYACSFLDEGERTIVMDQKFFYDHHKNLVKPKEILIRVFIPFTRQVCYVYKCLYNVCPPLIVYITKRKVLTYCKCNLLDNTYLCFHSDKYTQPVENRYCLVKGVSVI